MVQAIRAIYEKGQLRLLEPINLQEGQEIQVMIVSEKERVRAALGDLLVEPTEDVDILTPDEEATLMEIIAAAFKGQHPLSETLIQERDEGL